MSETKSAFSPTAESLVRQEVDAAYREQLRQLHELISSWPLEIERAFAAAKTDAIARVEQRYQVLLQDSILAARQQAQTQAVGELVGKLNQSVRCLTASENEGRWREALLDAAQGFSGRAALFDVRRGILQLHGTRNVPEDGQLFDVPVASAPAFASAIDTRDTIVAVRTAGEMSAELARVFDEAGDQKFYLFPVVGRGHVDALLYADGERTQVDSLELLTRVAGAVAAGSPSVSHPKGELVNIASARKPLEDQSWSALSEEERDMHRKAQRFARVQVASIRLYKSDAVKNGRTAGGLYTSLKEEIDSARGVFRRDFVTKSETMVDYLHLELVETLANNDVDLLGSDYPGPLV